MRIRKKHNFPASLQDTVPHAESLPTIGAVGNQTQAWIFPTISLYQIGRCVGGPIIHGNNLRAQRPSAQVGTYPLDRVRQALFLIKGRENNGQGGGGGGHLGW